VAPGGGRRRCLFRPRRLKCAGCGAKNRLGQPCVHHRQAQWLILVGAGSFRGAVAHRGRQWSTGQRTRVRWWSRRLRRHRFANGATGCRPSGLKGWRTTTRASWPRASFASTSLDSDDLVLSGEYVVIVWCVVQALDTWLLLAVMPRQERRSCSTLGS